MARIRTIKPEFFTSEDIVGLSPMARLLYIASWCEADREGRMMWKPITFKLRYFPGDNCDIQSMCLELVESGLVVLYGEGMAYVPSFGKHQHVNPREAKTTLPEPPNWQPEPPTGPARGDIRSAILERDGYKCVRCGGTDRLEIDHILPQSAGGPTVEDNLRTLCKPCNAGRPVSGDALQSDLALDGHSIESLRTKYSRVPTRADASILDQHAQGGREGKGREGKEIDASRDASRKRAPQKHPLPADFGISNRVRDWAAEKGHDRLDQHLESFRAKSQAKGYAYADWDAAFMEAIRENWAKLGPANVVPLESRPGGGRRAL